VVAIGRLEESARKSWSVAAAEDAFWREYERIYLEKFPDQFVAVSKEDGRFIVAADPDLLHLVELVRGHGLDMQHVWVRFMAVTPIRLAL